MDKHEQYAFLKAQAKEIDEQLSALADDILKDMVSEDIKSKEISIGKFTVTRRKSWTYPEKVVALGDKFKLAKAKAESTGEATYTESESLLFTPVKIK